MANKQQTAELLKAIRILEAHQKWRQGKTDEMPFTPSQLTEALDVLINHVKHSLPDEQPE